VARRISPKIDLKNYDYPADIERMIEVCRNNNIDTTPEEVDDVWCEYSEMFAAGWLTLPDTDEELFEILERHLELEA
jgi:hypothetical protein